MLVYDSLVKFVFALQWNSHSRPVLERHAEEHVCEEVALILPQ